METEAQSKTATETVERARAIYERDIRSAVEPQHHGKYVAIDVASADYLVGDEHLDIAKAMRQRHPQAEVAVLRIGHRVVGRIGWRARSAAE